MVAIKLSRTWGWLLWNIVKCYKINAPTTACNKVQFSLKFVGLGIRSSVFWANRSFFVRERTICSWKEQIATVTLFSWARGANWSRLLFSKEQQVQFAHSRSFLKSDESKSLPSLFTKEGLSKEQWEWFALGHEKGGNCQKYRVGHPFFSKECSNLWFLFRSL